MNRPCNDETLPVLFQYTLLVTLNAAVAYITRAEAHGGNSCSPLVQSMSPVNNSRVVETDAELESR